MKQKRILMIVEHAYPDDLRVSKEAQYLKDYYDVTIFALKGNSRRYHEDVQGVEVFRIPELHISSAGIKSFALAKVVQTVSYVMQYVWFTLITSILFLLTVPVRRYRVIHAHNPPDTLFCVGLIGKLFFAKFVFDHHDLSPELYLARMSDKQNLIYKILVFCERMSCRLADAVIATNESYKVVEMTRHGIESQKIFIVRNDPILSEFRLHRQELSDTVASKNERQKILFIGSINPQDGIDQLLHALHHLVHALQKKNFICNIVGDGDSFQAVKKLANDLGLSDFVRFPGYINDRNTIRRYLLDADVCVEPAPFCELNRHSTFIKIMEYMAAGKPIVAFDLKETLFSTSGSAILLPPGDIKGFACSINKLLEEPELRRALGKVGLERVSKELTWEKSSHNLHEAYKSLLL